MTERKKNKLKWLLTIGSAVLSVVALVGVCFGFSNLAKTKSVNNGDFAVGTIVAESGKIVESKHSAYMKDAENVDGLTIDIDEETATITYKVAFYDEDGKFISMTETMDEDFDATNIPSNATLFRVIVTPYPIDDTNVELNVFNMGKYVSQLDITFNK